jgi:hypothetical protein
MSLHVHLMTIPDHQPRSGDQQMISLVMTKSDHTALKIASAKHGVSMSSLIRRSLRLAQITDGGASW